MGKQPPDQDSDHQNRNQVAERASSSQGRNWRKVEREKSALYDSGCLKRSIERIAGTTDHRLPEIEDVEVISKPRTRRVRVKRS